MEESIPNAPGGRPWIRQCKVKEMTKYAIFAAVACIACILIAGCTSEAPSDKVQPNPIETPAVAVPTETPIPVITVVPVETPAAPVVDPIVGHYIQVNENVQERIGTEIIVLDDNSIMINIGPAKEKSSKYTINPVVQLTGTIKRVSEGKYYAALVYAGEIESNPVNVQINLIPECRDPDVPARIIQEHLETQGLREAENGSNQEGVPTSFKFPVRVGY